MNQQAPVSMCIICKNEDKTIEDCLKSIRPFVKEIVVVDTGSTDGTLDIVKKYADKWEVFTACNDEEGIFDFSMARNRSFELATQPFTSWCDADDVIENAHLFMKYTNLYKDIDHPHFIQFPYEYSYDASGNCSLVHYRERLFAHNDAYMWVSGVHEVRIPKPEYNQAFSCETQEDIIWKHRRQFVNKVIQPNRNLRILKKWYEKNGESDARQLYYLGLEYGNCGDLEMSKKFLNRYMELSGWDDERYMAALRLIDYDLFEGNYEAAINHALDAVKIKEDWGEAYFILSKCHYFFANSGKDEIKNWNKCVNFAKIGLSLPPTKTLLFVNPNERNVEIHRYLNIALGKLNRVSEALEVVNIALHSDPNHQELLLNKKVYEEHLKRYNALASLEELHNGGLISTENKDNIIKLLNNEIINTSAPTEKDIKNEVKEQMKEEFKKEWKPYHRPEGYPRNVQESDLPIAEITPHSQAWGIPETFVYDDLPMKMTDKQLQSMVVATWKEFMFGDELLSAISFLENAPHRVRHTNETEDLLRKTKNMVSWIKDPVAYDKGNSTLDHTGKLLTTDMTPLTHELNGSAFLRYQWMTDRMPDKNKSICDLAAIDGQMTNRWGLKGWKNVVGVDCCTNSIKIANEKAAEFNTGARHIQCYFDKAPEVLNEKFDNITAGDVYEHLLDPVNDLLIPARKLVKEDGQMLLTTPFGSWFQNTFCANAHPWLWGNEGEHWLSEKDRGHIIAPSVWTTAEHFRQAGWYVKECTYFKHWYPQVENQGNVCVQALPNAPKSKYESKDIIFFMGDGLETVNPHIIDIQGMGGSELALREMSKRLAAEGHKVRVYAGCGKHYEGIYEGVEWRETNKFHDLKCDILISSRQSTALDESVNVKAKLNILWCHDLYPKSFNEEYANKVDIIFALSNWHKEFMLSQFSYLKEEKVIVTGNGIDFDRFDRQKDIVVRDPHKMIVSSSPDRYLASMLKIFPKIKAKVPDATLNIAYGFFNWRKSAELQGDQGQLRLINELEEEIIKLEPLGVKMLGRINQFDLAREFLSAGVWTLSSWFAETNCISFSEAISAGCAVVTSNNAALKERVLPELGAKIDGDWLSDEYINKFAAATVNAMLNTKAEDRQKAQKYARENLSWDKFANDWNEIFSSRLDKKINHNVVDIRPFELKKYIPLIDRK